MSRNLAPRRHSLALPLILVGVVVAAVVVVSLAFTRQTDSQVVSPQPTVEHFVDLGQQDHHAVTGGRLVVVAESGEQATGISGETGPLFATLVRGQLPLGSTQATVKTDENCAADQDGVSHCLNELDFGGTSVVVQHHHPMATVSCLTPGEVVQIETASQYQAQS